MSDTQQMPWPVGYILAQHAVLYRLTQMTKDGSPTVHNALLGAAVEAMAEMFTGSSVMDSDTRQSAESILLVFAKEMVGDDPVHARRSMESTAKKLQTLFSVERSTHDD